MGFYDRIIYPAHCEACKGRLSEFQTQDTRNPAFIGVPLAHVNYFYTTCYCGASVHFKRNGNEFDQYTITPESLRVIYGHAKPAYPDGKGPEA